MSAGVLLQLLRRVEPLSTLQAPDLIRFGFLVAPAARVLLVLLELLLTEELSQTRHAVDALGLAVVLAVQLCQAEVTAASYAGVRQQAQVGEAVLQEGVLLHERLRAVGALQYPMALSLAVTREGLQRGETAAADLAFDVQHTRVQLHVVFARLQGREHVLAQVTLVELILKVSTGQVAPQILLGREAEPTDPAHERVDFGLGVCP